jgi:hypothetical protein
MCAHTCVYVCVSTRGVGVEWVGRKREELVREWVRRGREGRWKVSEGSGRGPRRARA